MLVVDWDVHHGNGTQDIFYSDPTVMFFSTHQWPWYPGTGEAEETGEGTAKGLTINCPLPAGSGRKEVLGAFEHRLKPAVKAIPPRPGTALGRFRLAPGRSSGTFHAHRRGLR